MISSVLRRLRNAVSYRRFARLSAAMALPNARRIALTLQRAADEERAPNSCLPVSSRLCTREQLDTQWFRDWCGLVVREPRLHRKLWEFAFIAQALRERELLQPGKRGLGFGVGSEPLVALFASLGVEVVATDQPATGASANAWGASGQHASRLEDLRDARICTADRFDDLVRFEPVDMNAIPEELAGFDFVWSSCAFEHLGSLDAGLRFVERAMDCLRPGGVAVHTTEFNLTSNAMTIEEANLVVYRRRDIDALVSTLRYAGHRIDDIDFSIGDQPVDHFVDLPPYGDEPHLRLQLGDYACTSLGLIVERSSP